LAHGKPILEEEDIRTASYPVSGKIKNQWIPTDRKCRGLRYISPAMAEPHFDKHVFICTNRREPGNLKGDCASKGGEALKDEFKRLLHERGLKGRIRANAAGCLDQCARGATVVVYPEQVWYGNLQVADVATIIDEHLVGDVPVERLRMR
jgi:(2Fe-2S) ferredoxin